MAENLRLARLYFVILAIVAGGRWVMSFLAVPYAKGTDKLSIVIITLLSSVFYGAFCRRWLGLKLLPAVSLGATLGLSAQIVVFVSTVLSYLFGLETYYNNPVALNATAAVSLGTALATRALGLVANTFTAGIAGALGWAMGALLPETRPAVLPRSGV
jgi:hypothetical protein